MIHDEFMLTVNAITCAAIAIRLLAYQRRGGEHRPFVAFLAWLLIVSCGSVSILIATGNYGQANLPETVINIALLVAVLSARGNVARLAMPMRDAKRGIIR